MEVLEAATLYPGVYLGHPVPGGYKFRDLVFQVGRSLAGLRDSDPSGTALAKSRNNSNLQTRPLVKEGATK
jgi:hypothetical protein